MIHEAILQLYSNARTVNGDTEKTITVWDEEGKELSIDWNKVQKKASELQTVFETEEKNKVTKKASAITKLKNLGLDDDEINALIGQ
tara:strand:- start:45 stop:305 length:261 start_codon:yes stop_codon:yes gene_type:complete